MDLLLPKLIAFVAGLVIHLFIIGVNVNDWWKGRSVTPVDHIVTSLGICRMCIQCADILYVFVSALTPRNPYSDITLDIVYCFFSYVNTWLTSLLSIVLCLKISNLHTRLFLYLRRTILHRTGHFIVAALLLPALNSLMPLVMFITEITKVEAYNTTIYSLSTECSNIHILYNYAIGSFIPLLFCSISSMFLFTSLYHHTTRMKMSSNLSINLETYYSVMRFVSFTFICNTIYFTVDVMSSYYYYYCQELTWVYIVLDILPVLHSSYMIYRTAKLRDEMSKVLHNVIDFVYQRKITEIRENIEIVAMG